MKYILYAKTDSAEATLVVTQDAVVVVQHSWLAGRELSKDLLREIDKLLKRASIEVHDLNGLAIFAGPGSFTGLRIGVSVFNALADGLQIPIIGVSGDDWMQAAQQRLDAGRNDQIVAVIYDGEANITQPRK